MAPAKRNRSEIRKVSTSKWRTRSSMMTHDDAILVEAFDKAAKKQRLVWLWEYIEYHRNWRKHGEAYDPNRIFDPNSMQPKNKFFYDLRSYADEMADERIVITKPSMMKDNKERKAAAMQLAELLDKKKYVVDVNGQVAFDMDARRG